MVWHTQGSGKSLTMLWLATKLRREPRLGNPTIVVVTDRTQLDRQISGTFERCSFPAPERMDRSRPEPPERRARRDPRKQGPLDLQTVLRSAAGRTVMTTIQKFAEALRVPESELDVLNPWENMIVMVDEAHRSQYGPLGARMSKALPNATLIGFTSTLIDKSFRRSTMRRFGSLIDAYTIPQSVVDGATVPIWYEARLPDLAIEGPETLDRLFEAMFGDESDEVQARIRRRYAHEQDSVATEKTYGLVVDYHGVSRDLEAALSTFEWPDVQDAMSELEEDPAPVIEAAAVRAESHFKCRDLGDTWACVGIFAPDASTEGDYKADLFERFDADYRQLSHLMDRFLPDSRAVDYVDRLARLTEIRAYVRAQFLREDADVDWTEIGAKVKKLVDERIGAQVRELMKPVSILDRDFEQKVAGLPHDEARASIMEHAIRAQIRERLADNPVFFEKLSARLAQIIEDLRNRLIDAAEACRRLKALGGQVRSEADIAAEHGLSPVSFAIYELLDGRPEESDATAVLREERPGFQVRIDDPTKEVSRKVEGLLNRHRSVVDWQSNLEVQREMRRDIKRELRPTGDYTEERLEELASQIVELARWRSRR